MKLRKVCLISSICLLALASMVVINPGSINLGEVINHPWRAVIYLF